jgi:hypothetical protein
MRRISRGQFPEKPHLRGTENFQNSSRKRKNPKNVPIVPLFPTEIKRENSLFSDDIYKNFSIRSQGNTGNKPQGIENYNISMGTYYRF